MRRAGPLRTAVTLALALLLGAAAGTAPCAAPKSSAGDQAFASYAFAAEFGSGIYEFNGRAMQIYRLPFSFEQEGWRLTMPVTVGLLDFRSRDIIDFNLPSGIGSVSLVPGIEHDQALTEDWALTKFVKAGYTKTSEDNADAVTFGLGVESNLRRPGTSRYADGMIRPRAFEYLVYNELNLAVSDLRGPLPGDEFLRFRSAVLGDFGTHVPIGERRLRIAPYALVDIYIEPPTSPITGHDADRWQAEMGFSLSLDPRPSRLGIHLPALGMSYRIAGELSGWRLAIGAPF